MPEWLRDGLESTGLFPQGFEFLRRRQDGNQRNWVPCLEGSAFAGPQTFRGLWQLRLRAAEKHGAALRLHDVSGPGPRTGGGEPAWFGVRNVHAFDGHEARASTRGAGQGPLRRRPTTELVEAVWQTRLPLQHCGNVCLRAERARLVVLKPTPINSAAPAAVGQPQD